MNSEVSVNIRKFLILGLLLFGFGISVYSQRQFTGNLSVNYPSTHVTIGAAIGTNTARVSDVTGFLVGDTVMIIQMQGVGIQTATGFYGVNVQSTFGSPGKWEFHIIASINGGTKDFTFKSLINTDFNVIGNVQIVKVPYCNNGIISGTLTADKWDPIKKSGGVLAVIAGRNIKIAGDIDMSGRGFTGGKDTTGAGICSNGNSIYDEDSYSLADTKSGMKGEGVAIHNEFAALLYPVHARGQGMNLTGGGGGNGKYTGGGGGSNRGDGGLGGEESSLCGGFLHDGGFGGKLLTAVFSAGRIFAGGGGGASTSATGTSSVPGNGNGGGIIFIIADSLVGAGGRILSDGVAGYNGKATGGAGGGGAGGSIVLTVKNTGGTAINFLARGGKGGDNAGQDFGAGGGGGGGLVWVPNNVPVKDIVNISGGVKGVSFAVNNEAGSAGIKQVTALDPNLKGFLFNSIWSAGNGLRRDSVCAGMPIPKLKGTTPVGGTGPGTYTFLWEKSSNGGSTWQTIGSAPEITPAIENVAGTYLYRRTVTDASAPAIVDQSLNDTIIVQGKITGNTINVIPDIICYGQKPNTIFSVANPVVPVLGDTTYTWFRWTAGGTDRTNLNNGLRNYIPSENLTDTTYYLRIVASGKCIDSAALKLITVLPLIQGNDLLSADEEKCNGSVFTSLTAAMPGALAGGGGGADYRYRWIDSPNGTDNWTESAGAPLVGTNYNPVEAAFTPYPKTLFYRRIVYSGTGDVCVDTSSIATPIKLTMWAPVTGNTISGDTTICKNSPAQVRRGTSSLAGGDGTYTYYWERSTNSGSTWTAAPGTTASLDPGTLPGPVWFRRTVYSGQLNACTDISLPSRVNMYRSPTGQITTLTDTITCTGTPARLALTMTGKQPFTVEFSDNVNTGNSVRSGIMLSDTVIFKPRSTAASTLFRYQIASIVDGNTCRDSLRIGSRNVNVFRYPVANAGPMDSVCGPLYTLKAVPSTSTTSFWKNIPAGVTVANINSATSQASVNAGALTGWRRNFTLTWREENGDALCFSENNVTITFAREPYPVRAFGLGSDSNPFYTFDYADEIYAGDPVVGVGEWKYFTPSGLELTAKNDTTWIVRNFVDGNNSLTWTVTNGICTDEVVLDYLITNIYIPQAFSPNSDGINDLFRIQGLFTDEEFSKVELTILNSSGGQVFYTTNKGQAWKDWDGKNSKGEDLPEGTYYYMLRTESDRSGSPNKSGFIILKRSYFE